MSALLPEELKVIDLLGQAWNRFLELPQRHPQEQPDFLKAIHDAQRLIMARPVQAELNEENGYARNGEDLPEQHLVPIESPFPRVRDEVIKASGAVQEEGYP